MCPLAQAEDEISLFNRMGKPAAFIALDDEMTVYLLRGKPVAYLVADTDAAFNVYGFNGRHLGWYFREGIWDHSGHLACASKDKHQKSEFEPFKSARQSKPFKTIIEFAPYRPKFSSAFSDTACNVLLASGAK